MEYWIPAVTTSGLMAVFIFLCRNLILERLKNAVKHEYDSKLTKIKSDLDSKQKEIEAIRSGTLSNLAQRQNTLYKRQIEAIEGLWDAVIKLATAKAISVTLASINFENAVESAETDQKVREMFEMLNPIDLVDMPRGDALKERPFVSPLSWAYYSAYEAIVMHAALRMHMLKKGINLKKVIDNDHVVKLVKVALPHQTEYVEKYGAAGFHYLLDELEQKLLLSFSLMLDGAENDKATIKKAAEITKQAEELSSASSAE